MELLWPRWEAGNWAGHSHLEDSPLQLSLLTQSPEPPLSHQHLRMPFGELGSLRGTRQSGATVVGMRAESRDNGGGMACQSKIPKSVTGNKRHKGMGLSGEHRLFLSGIHSSNQSVMGNPEAKQGKEQLFSSREGGMGDCSEPHVHCLPA